MVPTGDRLWHVHAQMPQDSVSQEHGRTYQDREAELADRHLPWTLQQALILLSVWSEMLLEAEDHEI